MKLYRIVKPKRAGDPLDGTGARLHGGRWNMVGTPMLYCAGSLALAALEVRVHTPGAALGIRWSVITLEVDDAEIADLDRSTLPADWAADPGPEALKQIGSRWAEERRSLALRVPSAVIPSEGNVLVNVLHPDLGRVRHHSTEDFRFDPRLAR